jgi:hypothetical protein
MRTKLIARNVVLIVVFGVIGLTQFTENVRTVQILGLLASGAIIGSSLAMIIVALKAKQKTD